MIFVSNPLAPLEDLLRSVLEWLHITAGFSWAWSIVVLTLLVRLAILPLTIKQIHSMQSLQAHAPEMKAIQQRWKHDKQRQQQELMAFYKENKINPLASCLPIVAQLPVFFSLYFVLKEFSREEHAASTLGWLHFVPDIAQDASAHWSGYLLIFIYATSQIASTYFMATSADPRQRYIMMALPLFAVFFVIHFPAGLVLYWVTSNLWTVGQGLMIKRLMPRPPARPPKRTSRSGSKGGDDGSANGSSNSEGSGPGGSGSSPQQVRKVKRKKKKGARR